jgi:hypothetical protein
MLHTDYFHITAASMLQFHAVCFAR